MCYIVIVKFFAGAASMPVLFAIIATMVLSAAAAPSDSSFHYTPELLAQLAAPSAEETEFYAQFPFLDRPRTSTVLLPDGPHKFHIVSALPVHCGNASPAPVPRPPPSMPAPKPSPPGLRNGSGDPGGEPQEAMKNWRGPAHNPQTCRFPNCC